MAVKVFSSQIVGLEANIVSVEADISPGLNAFSVVGLPDKAVEESKDRVSAAIKNCGLSSPKSRNQKTVVSLAPADLKKEGPAFDLAISLAYLLASKQIDLDFRGKMFLGELALDGSIRSVKGVLSLVRKSKKAGFKEIFVPKDNAEEAALVDGIKIFGCGSLNDVVKHFDKKDLFSLVEQEVTKTDFSENFHEAAFDFADVKGQETAKRGLEIAAAGGHNILMSGPAGTGKTMLARAFAGILPGLSKEEILEVTSIQSAAGILNGPFAVERPFRSPHHTSSYVALVGGGTYPKPGEITLSHRGVLFLDEFPEFEKRSIEALRQPLEDKIVNVSRAKASLVFPANFILVCAMNPCPCGNFGSKTKACVCSQGALMRYQRKISGPIIDRIDLWLEVPQVEHEKLSDDKIVGEGSEIVKRRIAVAREKQKERFKKTKGKILTNGEMGARELKEFTPLDDNVKIILNEAAKKLDLSGRAYHRVIKIARTIADLAGDENIKENHIFEALQYRPK